MINVTNICMFVCSTMNTAVILLKKLLYKRYLNNSLANFASGTKPQFYNACFHVNVFKLY